MSGTLKTLLAKLKRRRKKSAHQAQKSEHDDTSRTSGLPITDRMANLTVSAPPTDVAALDNDKSDIVHFGRSQAFDFTFSCESFKAWPGPKYDKSSMFAPGVFDKARPVRAKAKHKSSKRKLSQEGGQLALRPKELPSVKPIRQVPESRKSPRPVHYYGKLPSRDPPHHLLNLPGEIRNQFYRMLCVASEPIIAQFRPIIKPKSGRDSRAKMSETTKRFPREPTLALVSRQLMREILSIFYGENTFVFRRSEDQRFKDLIMTQARMVSKWAPKPDFVSSLRCIEVHFVVRPMVSGKETAVYTFRTLADGSIKVSNNASELASSYCKCFEHHFINQVQQGLGRRGPATNLLKEAANLGYSRFQELLADPSWLSGPDGLHRSRKMICENCGLNTPRLIESGLGRQLVVGS